MKKFLKDPSEILDALEKYMYEKQLTQEQLAKMFSVTLATVNYWINRKRTPRKLKLYKIQKFLEQEGFLK